MLSGRSRSQDVTEGGQHQYQLNLAQKSPAALCSPVETRFPTAGVNSRINLRNEDGDDLELKGKWKRQQGQPLKSISKMLHSPIMLRTSHPQIGDTGAHHFETNRTSNNRVTTTKLSDADRSSTSSTSSTSGAQSYNSGTGVVSPTNSCRDENCNCSRNYSLNSATLLDEAFNLKPGSSIPVFTCSEQSSPTFIASQGCNCYHNEFEEEERHDSDTGMVRNQ